MPYAGELSALVTAACWSLSSIAFASATVRAGALPVNVTRLVLATLYLAITVAAAGLSLRLSASQLGLLSLSGIIGLAFGDSFLFLAYREVGARVTMLMMALAPGVAALLAWPLLGDRLSVPAVAGIMITLAGVATVVMEREKGPAARVNLRGLWYGALAAVGQGVGLIVAKMAFLQGEINGFAATFVRLLASLLIMLPLGIAGQKSTGAFRSMNADPRAFGLTALGAVFGPFLGIAFSLIAVARTEVGVAATIMAMQPILMLPLVRIIYRERLSRRSIAGACVAVAGVAILFLR